MTGAVLLLTCRSVALAAAAPAPPPPPPPPPPLLLTGDCRYLTTERDLPREQGETRSVWLPPDNLFRPPLADMKQPRFYMSLRQTEFKGEGTPGGGDGRITAGLASLGADFGLWTRRRAEGCDGLQVSLFASIFSQFNLNAPSDDLINSDFLIGSELTLRRGIVSARLRILHQSSHLGDEFVLDNPDVDRVNLSFEAMDVLVSVEKDWWRVYAGGGYLTGARPELDPGILQAGFELRAPGRPFRLVTFVPLFGADLQSLEDRGWGSTFSVMGGVEIYGPTASRRIRILLAQLKGYIPFGQFFNTEKITNYGLHLQFEY